MLAKVTGSYVVILMQS